MGGVAVVVAAGGFASVGDCDVDLGRVVGAGRWFVGDLVVGGAREGQVGGAGELLADWVGGERRKMGTGKVECGMVCVI